MNFGGNSNNSLGNATARTLPLDTTPPDITGTLSPLPNANGWHNSSVTVSWSVRDPESGIYSSTACGTTTLNSETPYTILTCTATNGAGMSGSRSVTVRIDKTAPEAAISFDSASKDIGVYDSETGDEARYRILPSKKDKGDEKGWELRQYTLKDNAGNTLSLVLKYKKGKKETEINVVSAQYNGGAVIEEVKNTMQVRYSEGNSFKELEQKIEARKQFAIEAKYKAGKGETEIRMKLEGRKEQKERRAGIVILELLTDKGGFKPRY